MISSMTGFGSAEGKVGSLGVSVEIRTVNHRFFNPSIKLPAIFGKWEGDVRELLRQRIARGHVTVAARIEREGT
ncbi:MAG: YicC/YloC family endoribonuclease, partial [Gemmatimonadaceae bacterium]